MPRRDPETYCEMILIQNHSDYLEVLNKIRKETAKIVIVQIDGRESDDPIVETAKNMMILEKEEAVSRWFGTIAPGREAIQYTFVKKREFFGFLSAFESFFINKTGKNNSFDVDRTDFGLDDIAFIDTNGELLFYTTTHEGYAYLNARFL